MSVGIICRATALADRHPGAMRLDSRLKTTPLPASSVPAAPPPVRTQEGDLCCRRLDRHRRLSQAARWHLLPGSRTRPLRLNLAQDRAKQFVRQIAELGLTCQIAPAILVEAVSVYSLARA